MRADTVVVLVLAAVALGTVGCGESPRVTVRYDGATPTVAAPPPPTRVVPPTAAPTVAVVPTVAVATPPPPPPPTHAEPTAAPTEPEIPLTVHIDFEGGNFVPRVKLLFQKPDGTLVAEDFASPDGRGISRNLDKVRRGDYYRFRASSDELMVPYYDKVLHITHDTYPRFHLGSVTFKLPEKLLGPVNDGMKVRIKKQPLGDVVFDGTFSTVRAYSVFGDPFPHMLVLDAGEYSYTVYDVDKKDAVMITDGRGGEGVLPEDGCTFVVSKAFPKAIVDLSPVFGEVVKKAPKPEYVGPD